MASGCIEGTSSYGVYDTARTLKKTIATLKKHMDRKQLIHGRKTSFSTYE